ncbi:putative zinc-binding protein [Arhodomonas aquaeolei]|uniref:putative zinc-binding protein n=1 Tax=Arhodomonas aquaeolei TaxID=2369 RepID=UPI00036B56DB|nr:putative zinc-binding protein [Arhodomonas aquaeolei]
MTESRPLVYACSGCSNVAQLANRVAVAMDRDGRAEMSCIAGVGGGVLSLVRRARSGRPVIAIDGCPLACVRHCLEGVGVTADYHTTLTDHDLRKRYREDYGEETVAEVRQRVEAEATGAGLFAPATDASAVRG